MKKPGNISSSSFLASLKRFLFASSLVLFLIPLLVITLLITATVQSASAAADRIIEFLNVSNTEEDQRARDWYDRQYPVFEKYSSEEYSQYYLAVGISCWSSVRKGTDVPPSRITMDEYMEYFITGNAADIIEKLREDRILQCDESEEMDIMSLGQQFRLEAEKDSADSTEWTVGRVGSTPHANDYPRYTDYWNTVLAYPGQPFTGYGGQCTSYAWYRFYECYGYPSGAAGDGKYNAQSIVNAHPDLFELSSVPKAGAVFSGYRGYSTNQHGHVGFIEEVTDQYIYTSEGNMLPDESGSYGEIWEYHRWDRATFMNRYNDGHPDSYLIFAVPVR